MGNGKINTGMIKVYLLDINEMGRADGSGRLPDSGRTIEQEGSGFFSLSKHEVTPSRTCHEVILHISAWTTYPTPFPKWQLHLNY